MGRRTLIISRQETFMIKGLEMKLKSIDVEAVYASPELKEIESSIEEVDLIILYTDDTIEEAASALVYIKDNCLRQDRKVIVIGNEDEYKIVEQYLIQECILQFFERPLDMNGLLDRVAAYLDEEAAMARRKRILIVDDDMSYMMMVYDWLKDKYHVALAGSGMQAITWLANNHADLILLDYEMPVTSGPQVLEMFRSEPQTQDIPVIFLTGKNDKASIMRVLSLRPADYLLKTIDKKGLCEKLESFFMLN